MSSVFWRLPQSAKLKQLELYEVAKPPDTYRGPSAYMLFSQAQRALLNGEQEEGEQEALPAKAAKGKAKASPRGTKRKGKAAAKATAGGEGEGKEAVAAGAGPKTKKMSFIAMAKIIGERWRALSEEERIEWELKSAPSPCVLRPPYLPARTILSPAVERCGGMPCSDAVVHTRR